MNISSEKTDLKKNIFTEDRLNTDKLKLDTLNWYPFSGMGIFCFSIKFLSDKLTSDKLKKDTLNQDILKQDKLNWDPLKGIGVL